MDNISILVENINFNYGHLKVIDNISLEVSKGTSFGLLGSNGAGKTTFIRLMVGLLKPAEGKILVLGKQPSPTTAKNIGYMPQLPSLYVELTVRQNIDFFARIYGLRDKNERFQRVDEVITGGIVAEAQYLGNTIERRNEAAGQPGLRDCAQTGGAFSG
jgi:ABC-2 type transport system ATP-binding protein